MHRLQPLRAGLRGGAGHLRADHRRARLRQPGERGRGGGRFPVVGLRQLRRLRAGLPDRDPAGEIGHRARHAHALGRDHLRLLRGRLFLQGGTERRRAGAHGALQARQGEPGPFLREGPLRLGLCQPCRAHPEPDDPRHHRGALARGELGGGDDLRRDPPQGHPGAVWPQVGRRDHLQPLHQRGDLPRPETDPRRVRQQQHRHLRAGVPFAHGLRAWPDLRHLRRHAGFRQRDEGGCGHRHRREPDRRAPGLRLAAEEAAAGRARS
jgi:hypothetical protein